MDTSYMLHTDTARRLYALVQNLPIIDYHCHLSPEQIDADLPFDNIGEVWLAGDHYKWRLMRAAGIPERYITGDAGWHDKFIGYISALELAAGNPLYHWSQMELALYFDVRLPLAAENAEQIWMQANAAIADRKLSPCRLMQMAGVEYAATTDDPVDDLVYHRRMRTDGNLKCRITPSFRTDKVLQIRQGGYAGYIQKLGEVCGFQIKSLEQLQRALTDRLDFFVENGCRFTDVGIAAFPEVVGDEAGANAAFRKALAGDPVNDREYAAFLGWMYVFLAGAYKQRSLVMQWHLAAYRNANTLLYDLCGADAGGDCIGDCICADWLIRVLDAIHRSSGLPKTVLYTLNPAMAPQLCSIAGCFPEVLCGAAWWFCDHLRGIRAQICNIAEIGYLGSFLGMLTDSRSFLSYARHDYFRRIFCDVVGGWVENGEYDATAAQKLVRSVCYENLQRLTGDIR